MAEEREQFAFNIKADFKFAKTNLTLQQEIETVVINMRNHQFVPKMTMTFYISTKYRNMLLMPYTVKLRIIEKNRAEDERTVMENEWLSYNQSTPDLHMGMEQSSRPDIIKVTHTFIAKDTFSAVNTVIGGLYEKTTIKDVIQDMWNKTNHGTVNLEISKLDNNETYDQIWIPNNKFFLNLSYISQRYGMFNIPPVMYSDVNSVYIKSLNEATKEKALELYSDLPVEEQSKLKVDQGQYYLHRMPQLENSFNNISSTIPKKILLCKRSNNTLYEEEEIDVIDLIKSLRFVDSTDSFDEFLDSIVIPKTKIYLDQTSTYSIKESIASIIMNTVKPLSVNISHPFRFHHWYIGRKAVLKYKHLDYQMGSEITFFISGLNFIISRKASKRVQGTISATLSCVSTRNAFIGG
jgi:hypothetical protein